MELNRALSIVIEGENFELPKRNVVITKKFDEFNKITNDDVKMHYKALEIIELVLGKDSIASIFKTSNKEEISTIESIMVLKAIDNEYMKPIIEEQDELLNKLKDVSHSVSKIERVIK